MTFKEKWQRTKRAFNFAHTYGDKQGQKLVINKFDGYRAISNVIIFVFICVFLILENYLYVYISIIVWHLHIMLNQLWWRVANLEYKIESKGKNR